MILACYLSFISNLMCGEWIHGLDVNVLIEMKKPKYLEGNVFEVEHNENNFFVDLQTILNVFCGGLNISGTKFSLLAPKTSKSAKEGCY